MSLCCVCCVMVLVVAVLVVVVILVVAWFCCLAYVVVCYLRIGFIVVGWIAKLRLYNSTLFDYLVIIYI